MVEKDKETKCPYPSLDLSFDWVKDILYHQTKLAEEYNAKLVTLLSVATGVVGIGVPFGVKIVEGAFKPWSSSFIAILVAIVTYVLIAILAAVGFWMRNYHLQDNPVVIREDFWKLAPWKFKEQILVHVEEAYKLNNHALRWRVLPTQAVIVLLPVETLSLALAFLLGIGGR
jgi:hypothetical protein